MPPFPSPLFSDAIPLFVLACTLIAGPSPTDSLSLPASDDKYAIWRRQPELLYSLSAARYQPALVFRGQTCLDRHELGRGGAGSVGRNVNQWSVSRRFKLVRSLIRSEGTSTDYHLHFWPWTPTSPLNTHPITPEWWEHWGYVKISVSTIRYAYQ